MNRISLTREINISRVERLLDQIARQPEQDIETHHQITGASLGGEAALIQLFLTWAKQHPTGRLHLKIDSEDDGLGRLLEKLSKKAFGFVSMLMADDIVTSDGQTCRKEAFQSCKLRVELMTGSQTLESSVDNSVWGHRTFLPCVDHSTKAFITPFYHSNGQFRGRSEFRRFAEVLFRSRSRKFVEANRNVVHGLGAILYELLHNTHDWARTDVDDSPVKKSIRGVLFTRLHLPKESIAKAAGDNSAIAQYMHSTAAQGPGQYIDLAELSVFDAGPGLAARWLANDEDENVDLSVSDEHQACIACLGVHRTTSSDAYRGVGLFDVMNTLSELSAMVRVRTGRVAMFRDFIASPLVDEERESGPQLPLAAEHSSRPGGLAFATGTMFTFLFPLK